MRVNKESSRVHHSAQELRITNRYARHTRDLLNNQPTMAVNWSTFKAFEGTLGAWILENSPQVSADIRKVTYTNGIQSTMNPREGLCVHLIKV
jgi:hypothetical protein